MTYLIYLKEIMNVSRLWKLSTLATLVCAHAETMVTLSNETNKSSNYAIGGRNKRYLKAGCTLTFFAESKPTGNRKQSWICVGGNACKSRLDVCTTASSTGVSDGGDRSIVCGRRTSWGNPESLRTMTCKQLDKMLVKCSKICQTKNDGYRKLFIFTLCIQVIYFFFCKWM